MFVAVVCLCSYRDAVQAVVARASPRVTEKLRIAFRDLTGSNGVRLRVFILFLSFGGTECLWIAGVVITVFYVTLDFCGQVTLNYKDRLNRRVFAQNLEKFIQTARPLLKTV
eukprot:INCI5133.6.p1 GENE.INCI5133.6~~INCI5133.6.p1  ORF type:complete len:112 (+),score=10.44 INCI5133.6:199-534(+)